MTYSEITSAIASLNEKGIELYLEGRNGLSDEDTAQLIGLIELREERELNPDHSDWIA